VGDYERWELAQLRKTGLLNPEDDPGWDAERGYIGGDDDSGEELEVEMIEDEPAFLHGQTQRGGAEHEAVRIVADPDGSMSRAATTQSALARERRELRQQQQQELLDSIPKDLNRPWVDPMPESGERHLAAEVSFLLLLHFTRIMLTI
jgi:ATP-dependent RNA helicase DHX8/PRP22